MAWPPTLDDVKSDADITDNRDDLRLQTVLDAAVVVVERVRSGFDYAGLVNVNTADATELQTLPGVDATIATEIIDSQPYSSVADVEAVVGTTVFDGIESLITIAPPPPDDLHLGTIRLAYRWHVRRRSPDALIDMAEMGAARVPSFDPDIERLLGIGRFRGPVFA